MKTINLNTISMEQLHARLKLFGTRGLALCGRTADGQLLGRQVKKFFDELLTSTTDPERIRQREEFMARAEKDPVARQQLCGIRVETINNYIMATINIMGMFFEVVNLADDERPVVQYTTNQEIAVAYVGSDGGLRSAKVVKEDDEVLINLHYLTTDAVRYRRVDIYRGTIVDAALKTLWMAYDLKNQMDARCYSLLTDATKGAFGTFRYYKDGQTPLSKRSQYTYLPNSRIDVRNLPATNDVVLGDNSTSTSFRIACLRAAKKYVSKWQGCFPEGDLALTGRVLIPGADAADISDEIVPSGSTRNRVADELMERGWARINYLGTDFDLHTDNTLPPNQCLFELNRKPGRVYLKPSQDREVARGEDVYELAKNNEEERWSQKVFGAYITSATRMNVLRVTYRAAA
jgi:hypothetical protein